MEGIARVSLQKQKIQNVLAKNSENRPSRANAIVDFLLKNNMKFNTFEIYNEFGTKVFNALDEPSIPTIEHINVMLKNGYKI